MNVLIVCTGNTCRSPMAAALLASLAKERRQDIVVDSAGIFAADGLPAAGHAIAVIRKMGLDLSSHRSKRLNNALLDWAEMVLVMDEGHQSMLLAAFGRGLAKPVIILHEPDPYGGDMEEYKKCAQHLQNTLEDLLDNGFEGTI